MSRQSNKVNLFPLVSLLAACPVEAAVLDYEQAMNWLITTINVFMAVVAVIASITLFKAAWESRQLRQLNSFSNLQRIRRYRMIVSSSYTPPAIDTRLAELTGALAGIVLVFILQGPWLSFVTTTLGSPMVSGSPLQNSAGITQAAGQLGDN